MANPEQKESKPFFKEYPWKWNSQQWATAAIFGFGLSLIVATL